MNDLLKMMVEQAPAVAALLYLVYRLDQRIQTLETKCLELLSKQAD